MTAQLTNSAKLEKRLSRRIKSLANTGNEICNRIHDNVDVPVFEINIYVKDLNGKYNAQTVVYKKNGGGFEYQILFDKEYILYANMERIKLTFAHEIAHCYSHEIYGKKLVDGYNKAKDKNKFMHDKRWNDLFKMTGYYRKYNCQDGGYEWRLELT